MRKIIPIITFLIFIFTSCDENIPEPQKPNDSSLQLTTITGTVVLPAGYSGSTDDLTIYSSVGKTEVVNSSYSPKFDTTWQFIEL